MRVAQIFMRVRYTITDSAAGRSCRVQLVSVVFLHVSHTSQLLTVVRNTPTSKVEFLYGREPSSGSYPIPGENDEPYSDRLVVCVRRGRTFEAMSLNDALHSGNAIVEDSSGLAMQGYRVVQRPGNILSELSKRKWTRTCRLIDSTLSDMFQACESLGYMNLTRDSLRIVDGLHSNSVVNTQQFGS